MNLTLHLKLLSDTTFGRGDGVSGLVDQEIEHDPATGLPFVRGRTLKGLLVEECANILYALREAPGEDNLKEAAQQLFGSGGSSLRDGGVLHVGNAELLPSLKEAAQHDINAKRLQPSDVLDVFTTIRRQTAMDEETGAPDDHSLRSSRVLLRETELTAQIDIALPDDDHAALALLCACAAGLRRGGTGRNRGRGRLEAWLEEVNMDEYLLRFEQLAGDDPR